ncbi:MAG: YqiA/YcfP family alpha/beta fold hydrolase [Methylococcaceae bacterium]|jgi:predicted esterase YcpF (UPF0227 family)
MIFYLHGFRSAPASSKARQLAQRLSELGMKDQFWCPQLPADPAAAIECVDAAVAELAEAPTFIGSSLGGFYAAYLSGTYESRAVLLNPASQPWKTLATFVGCQTNLYTGENFDFTHAHLAALHRFDRQMPAAPGKLWLIVETGDELIDYRESVARYADARQTVIEGGDHSLRHFPQLIDEIIDFALDPLS